MQFLLRKPVFFLCILIVSGLLAGCRNGNTDAIYYPTGNAVQDYFYKQGYVYPMYIDSTKPICRPEFKEREFGKWDKRRANLAAQAVALIKKQFINDSLLRGNDRAFVVFPVTVYFIDSPDCWYRVELKEFRNCTNKSSIGDGQFCDSGRIVTYIRNIEFLINEDGTLEYQCDQEL